MEINVRSVQGVTVVELVGELTFQSATPDTQQRVLELVQPGGRLILDLSRVPYMTSAGYRLLLKVYRAVTGQGGRPVLVGLSEDLKDTMNIIGFLDFFTHRDSLEEGLAELTP